MNLDVWKNTNTVGIHLQKYRPILLQFSIKSINLNKEWKIETIEAATNDDMLYNTQYGQMHSPGYFKKLQAGL